MAVGAELGVGGAIAIHTFTASSSGKGIGLAVDFLPLVVGTGTAILGETLELDPRPAFGFHGAVIGALPLMLIGASFDGRNEKTGARFGAATLSLGVLGAVGGAYFGATRIDSTNEAIAVSAAPFVGAFGGGLAFAVVHFFDDQGPKSTGRLLRFVGGGMLLGTLGSFGYAFKDRSDPSSTRRSGPSASRRQDVRIVSIGGAF
jgi:hypothetical protein